MKSNATLSLPLVAAAALFGTVAVDYGHAFSPTTPPLLARRQTILWGNAGDKHEHGAANRHASSFELDTVSSSLSRREYILRQLRTTAAIITAPLSLALLSLSPVVVVGVEPANAFVDEALIYNGVYTDPKHPKGYRVLIGSTKTATLRLQDDPGGEVYKLPVKVQLSPNSDSSDNPEQVQQFLFDFSSSKVGGGPANTNIVGKLSKDKEGISIINFDDGNTWKKRETGPIGVYQDGKDGQKIYVIRQFKGPELTVDIIKKDEIIVGMIKAKAGNPTIEFDFPADMGGTTMSGVFSMKKKTISFEDGNVWTKF